MKGNEPAQQPPAETGDEPAADSQARRTSMPEDPRKHPEQTVDALEEKISREIREQRRDESDTERAAFEQDIEPTEEPPERMHRVDEPPV
ncbi:MAG: hypothetical protein ACRDRN_06050 [Sciscionella sp.]